MKRNPRTLAAALAATAFVSIASQAQAQFSYSAVTTAAGTDVGVQNGGSFAAASQDSQTSHLVSNDVLTSSTSFSGQDGGMTYMGTGNANIVTTLDAGGYQATFSNDGFATITSGANSFDGPRGDAGVSHEVHFTVSQTGQYAVVAQAQLNTPVNQPPLGGGSTFFGQLWDGTTNTLVDTYNVASASNTFNNVNTTETLVAGESYYTTFYEFTYAIVPGYLGAPATDHLNVTGSITVGSPNAVPEPASFAILGVGAVAAIRRRRRA